MDFWKDAQFVVTDAPAPAPQGQPSQVAASPAGSFRMSRDEMDSTRQKAEALLDKIQQQLGPAQRLTTIRSPADEPVSNGVTATLNNAGEYYIGHLKQSQERVQQAGEGTLG